MIEYKIYQKDDEKKEEKKVVELELVHNSNGDVTVCTRGDNHYNLISFNSIDGTIYRHTNINPKLGFSLDCSGRIEIDLDDE